MPLTQLGGDTYENIGPLFVVFGNLFNWLLHGVLSVQIYLYYLAFPKDRPWTKAAVYTVYFLETIHVIGLAVILVFILLGDRRVFDAQDFGISFGHFYGSPALFVHSILVDIIGAIVPLVAQCIYAHRIRLLTGKKVISWLIIALAIVQVFAAIFTGLGIPFANCGWTGFNAINDLIIAFVMVRTLLKEKTLSRYTRSKVMDLVFLIIATGLLTVFVNLLALTLFATQSYIPSYTSTAIMIFMPKLYANSILVMFNNRITIGDSRQASSNTQSTNVVSTFAAADGGN